MQLAWIPAVLLLAATGLVAVMTTADWFVVVSLIVGSAGIAGVLTAYVGLARYRAEQKQGRIVGAAQVQTVAREEAESAMRIMGDTVDRVNDENRRIIEAHNKMADQYNQMRDDLTQCLEEQAKFRRGPH